MIFSMRSTDGLAQIEVRLWQHRARVLMLAVAVVLIRLWWGHADTVFDAHYSVREMLINYADGFVRRGLSGDILLTASHTFGGTPTIWASVSLGLLAVVLCAMVIQIYARLPNHPALVVLVLAPWGLLFLVYDADIMIRKEVFGYLALAAILLGTLTTNQWFAVLGLAVGCIIMPIAILLHEVNATLVGSLLIAAWMFLRAHPSKRRMTIGWVTFAICASTVSFISAALHATADPRVLCDAVDFAECEDPFAFLSAGAKSGTAMVQDLFNKIDQIKALLVLALGSLPFWALRLPDRRILPLIGLAAAIAIPVLPLFVVALDYGRWIQLIYFPASLLAATALSLGWVLYRRILPPVLTLLYCGTWSLDHFKAAPELWAVLLWPLLGCALAPYWWPKTKRTTHKAAP